MLPRQPLVSVVITAFNQAALIGDTVRSVLAQSHADVEIIVVDDGSVDGSADAVPAAPNVTVVRQANQGVAAARNHGFALSSGDYLLFLDGDDQLLPAKLARDVSLLERRPDLGAVYCAWSFFSADRPTGLGECHPRCEGAMLEDLLLKRTSPVPAVMTLRRSCLESVGLFDPACFTAGDYDLWIRLSLAGHRFGYVDDALVRYRILDGSMSRQIAKMEAAVCRVFDKAFADAAMPTAARALESRARAILQYELASECYRIGDRTAGREYLRRGASIDPALATDEDWVVEWLAAVALSPWVDAGTELIEVMLDDVPADAASRHELRHRVHAHVHLASTFMADQRRDRRAALAHGWRAMRLRPTVVMNRGFVRILLRAMAG